MAKANSVSDSCPMELGVNVLGGKWKLKILWIIYSLEVVRFNEIQRKLEDITTKTLTEQLRELEEQHIIKRIIYAEIPPKVEYSFTEIGKTLAPVMKTLCEWGTQYKSYLKSE